MVATRRPARRSASNAESDVGAAGAELTSVEGSSSVRTKRSRRKISSPSEVIPDSQSEKMKESETNSNVEEPLETQKTLNKSKALNLTDSVVELQPDGEISEAESNCSSVSGLHTPMFIRITRRRKIMVPCQPESTAKNRQSKKALPNEGSKCQEDVDISEAESSSSTVSGVRPLNTPRKTRSHQVKASVLPVCETQAEEVSDADSWCSGVSIERPAQFKRITRSTRMRSQIETMLQSENKSEVVVGNEKLPEYVTKSLPVVISDSEQPTKSDLEKEEASFSSAQNNEHSSPCKTKCHSESLLSDDPKQILSSSPKKMERECTAKSPETERRKDYESVDNEEVKEGMDKKVSIPITKQISDDVYEVESTEEICDQSSEKSRKVTEKPSPVKNIDMFLHKRNLEQSDRPSRQTTPNKRKNSPETPKTDTKRGTQNCFHYIEQVINVDKVPAGISQNSSLPIQTIESSDDDCRVSVASVDSDENQEEPVTETSSGATKKAGNERHFSASPLIIDDSSESENSDLEEINDVEVIASSLGTSSKNALALDKSLQEELFVIDKTPGLDSSKTYYLERDLVDDKESEKSKESSELEDSEEEFMDEDEDEDLLASNNKIVSFSSSIDPGLNVKQLGGLYINFDAGKSKSASHGIVPLKEKKKDELLQKSIITPDFEKKECIPPLKESTHQLKKQRRAEREKTTGDGWFGMKAPEMTEELKNDLQALKMRAAMDPKRFYKKNDRKGLPKYFQVGTIVDSPVDFYHARIPKKERKKNVVEELLADSEFRRYNKRKYQDIMAEKAALAAGKKKLKKKKFHK